MNAARLKDERRSPRPPTSAPAFKREWCDGAAQAKQPAHLATPNASGSNALARELWKSPGANSARWEGWREEEAKKFFLFPFLPYMCAFSCVRAS